MSLIKHRPENGGFRRIAKYSPARSAYHQNVPMTNIAINHIQDTNNFVANKAFPIVPVDRKSDDYYVFDKGDMLRHQTKKVSMHDYAPIVGFSATTAQYNCEIEAGAIPITEGQIWDSDYDMEKQAAIFLAQQVLIGREIDFSSVVASSTWTTSWTGVASGMTGDQFLQFNDSSSTPYAVFRLLMRAMEIASGGYRPNLGLFGAKALDTLLDHANTLARIVGMGSNNDPAVADQDTLATLLGLKKGIYRANSVYNSAAEGVTDAFNFIIPEEDILLLYVTDSPDIRTKSAGYCFAWSAYDGGNASAGNGAKPEDSVSIRTFQDEKIVGGGGKIMEGVTSTDFRVVAPDCGIYMENAVA